MTVRKRILTVGDIAIGLMILLQSCLILASDQEFRKHIEHEGFGKANEPPAESSYKRAWDSVFPLTNQPRPQFSKVGDLVGSGAGFVVHVDTKRVYILTARHTIPCAYLSKCQSFLGSKEGGEILVLDNARDLAVVSFPRSPEFLPQPVTFATENPKSGDKVTALGFPNLNLRSKMNP